MNCVQCSFYLVTPFIIQFAVHPLSHREALLHTYRC